MGRPWPRRAGCRVGVVTSATISVYHMVGDGGRRPSAGRSAPRARPPTASSTPPSPPSGPGATRPPRSTPWPTAWGAQTVHPLLVPLQRGPARSAHRPLRRRAGRRPRGRPWPAPASGGRASRPWCDRSSAWPSRRPELLGLLREVGRLGPPSATRLMLVLEPLVQRASGFLAEEMDAGHMRRHEPAPAAPRHLLHGGGHDHRGRSPPGPRGGAHAALAGAAPPGDPAPAALGAPRRRRGRSARPLMTVAPGVGAASGAVACSASTAAARWGPAPSWPGAGPGRARRAAAAPARPAPRRRVVGHVSGASGTRFSGWHRACRQDPLVLEHTPDEVSAQGPEREGEQGRAHRRAQEEQCEADERSPARQRARHHHPRQQEADTALEPDERRALVLGVQLAVQHERGVEVDRHHGEEDPDGDTERCGGERQEPFPVVEALDAVGDLLARHLVEVVDDTGPSAGRGGVEQSAQSAATPWRRAVGALGRGVGCTVVDGVARRAVEPIAVVFLPGAALSPPGGTAAPGGGGPGRTTGPWCRRRARAGAGGRCRVGRAVRMR